MSVNDTPHAVNTSWFCVLSLLKCVLLVECVLLLECVLSWFCVLSLHILTTSYNVTFFDLNDDVKTIIANCTSDYFISTMSILDKHEDLQKKLFGEIVFDNNFRKIKKYKMMLKKMMILIMLKYIRFIKISMM